MKAAADVRGAPGRRAPARVTGRSSRIATLALCVWAATVASHAAPADIKRLNGTVISEKALTARIQDLVRKAHVHGAAISIFNDRELVYSRAFGVKRTDTNEPLALDTGRRGTRT
jgi:CubicO group peptidase (beta-lactamase class C family)